MKPDWLKNQLTPAKRNSPLWSAFTGALEDMWNDVVEPTLIRISGRKSFFSMDERDMDTRIAEYGRFFVIGEGDKARRPMLLTQRLDEIHFKGTVQPIEQTFWREFKEMPFTWEPLYAPVDQVANPYGTLFATKREADVLTGSYGDFFLTSRSRIVLDLNELYARYPGKGTDEAVVYFRQQFTRIIAPLIPLHIVYDGLTLLLMTSFHELSDVLKNPRIDSVTDAGWTATEPPECFGSDVKATISGECYISPQPRNLAAYPVCLDAMPVDGWPLGVLFIIPPIFPARQDGDTRLYESVQHVSQRRHAKKYAPAYAKLMLKTLGQFGCIVEYSNGQVIRFGFPALVDSVILQLVAGKWREAIRKITYLSAIDEVKLNTATYESVDWLYQTTHIATRNAVITASDESRLTGTTVKGTALTPVMGEYISSEKSTAKLETLILLKSERVNRITETYLLFTDPIIDNDRMAMSLTKSDAVVRAVDSGALFCKGTDSVEVMAITRSADESIKLKEGTLSQKTQIVDRSDTVIHRVTTSGIVAHAVDVEALFCKGAASAEVMAITRSADELMRMKEEILSQKAQIVDRPEMAINRITTSGIVANAVDGIALINRGMVTLKSEYKTTELPDSAALSTVPNTPNHARLSESKDAVCQPILNMKEQYRLNGVSRDINTRIIRYDEMPIDAWIPDLTTLIPPVIVGTLPTDTRLYEEAVPGKDTVNLIVKTLNACGCIVSFVDGSLIRYAFPGNTDEAILVQGGNGILTTIRRLDYLS